MPRRGSSELKSIDGPVMKAPPMHSKATILVVDDEPAVLRVLTTRLNLAGYRVISAEDGEKAIEVFHNESPDLVVLDVMLPKLDGFAVCRRLRAESCVPIIFLTALEAVSHVEFEFVQDVTYECFRIIPPLNLYQYDVMSAPSCPSLGLVGSA